MRLKLANKIYHVLGEYIQREHKKEQAIFSKLSVEEMEDFFSKNNLAPHGFSRFWNIPDPYGRKMLFWQNVDLDTWYKNVMN